MKICKNEPGKIRLTKAKLWYKHGVQSTASSQRLSLRLLPATVFITGACLLIVEVAAVRLLSPYFGNTIYTFSSVITVVLGALSVGYMLGGRLADARPAVALFYGLIGLSGLSLFFFITVAQWLLPLFGYQLPLQTGPLLVALCLFTLPSVLLGMLSPFAIVLQKRGSPSKGVGNTAGTLFFWSTLGSIGGSLSAGFFFVPFVGVHTTLLTVSVVLLLLGLSGIILSRRLSAAWLLLGIPIIATSMLFTAPPLQAVIFDEDGTYERIRVLDSLFQDKPARLLLLDRSLSSGIDARSGGLIFPYSHYFRLVELRDQPPRHTLVLGAGSYTIPQALLTTYAEATVDVVDIEPKLWSVAKQYFGVKEDVRLQPHTGDARRWLLDNDTKYDLIFSDVYSSLFSLPPHLSTQEFFLLAKRRQTENGLFIANIIGSLSRKDPSLLQAMLQTLRSVWPNSAVFITTNQHSLLPQNIVFVGINGPLALEPCAPHLLRRSEPPFAELCQNFLNPERFPGNSGLLITDEYAPVEYLSGPLFAIAKTADPDFSADEATALYTQLNSLPAIEQQSMLEAELLAFGVNSKSSTKQAWSVQLNNEPTITVSLPNNPAHQALILEVIRSWSFANHFPALQIDFTDNATSLLECTDSLCQSKNFLEAYHQLLPLLAL